MNPVIDLAQLRKGCAQCSLQQLCLPAGISANDLNRLDQIVKRLESQDGKFGALLAGIIDSAPFQKMRTQATVTAAN